MNGQFYFVKALLVAGLGLTTFSASAGGGGSHDYYVHTEAYNPLGGGFQPSHITVDWLDGDVLSPPDDACGMRFEGDFTLNWYSEDFGLHDSIAAPDGVADVWLPSGDCGAWQGVAIETDDELYTPPYDFSGYVETYSKAYWINSSGQKLVYLYQPCHPMPSCILGPQVFVANGWADSLGEPILKLRAVQMALNQRGTATLPLVTKAAEALERAARTTAERVKYRRTVHTGKLEHPIRQIEDAALSRISRAQERVRRCSAELARSNPTLASRFCDAALHATLDARAALDTGDAWIE